MMNNTIKRLLTSSTFFLLWIISAILAGVAFVYFFTPTRSEGAVVAGQAMTSTTTDATFVNQSTTTKICLNPCDIGSITIASSSAASTTAAAIFGVWDSNGASTSGATSRKLATFPFSASGGTYDFNAKLTNGLIIDAPTGFSGVYVITYRQY